jgi:hypothetical protein
VRNAHERFWFRVDERRPPAVEPVAEAEGDRVGRGVGREHGDEQPRPPPEHGQEQRSDEEDEPIDADPGKVDEQPVQPADTVVDDPALEVPVETEQLRLPNRKSRGRHGHCRRFRPEGERAALRRRLAGARVVLQRLAERDPDHEDEHDREAPDEPALRTGVAAAAAAIAGGRRHGR